jgi:hypothetical protein
VIAVKPPLRYADRPSCLLADQGRYQQAVHPQYSLYPALSLVPIGINSAHEWAGHLIIVIRPPSR